MLNQITKGRVYAGFARGYQSRWVNTFGQPIGTINIVAGTYTLTISTSLVIDKELTLTGAGAGAESTIIQAVPAPGQTFKHVFFIQAIGANVSISAVTIRNGRAVGGTGGGVWSNGTLTLVNTTISFNSSGTSGGGIFNNQGTVNLTNSSFVGNSAPTDPDCSGC